MKIEHVIFDCDGTLVDSHRGVLEISQRALSSFLKRNVSLEEVERNFDPDVGTFYQNFGISEESEQQEAEKIWQDLSHEGHRGLVLYPEVEDLLRELKRLDRHIYVWTARDRRSCELILGALEILPLYKDISCGDDGMMKPHPWGLHKMLGDIEPSRCLMIGDTYVDIRGAKAFGARALGALWGEHVHKQALEDEGPCALVERPLDLLKYLD